MKSSARKAMFMTGLAMVAFGLGGIGFDLVARLSSGVAPAWHGIPIGALIASFGLLGAGWIGFTLLDGHFDELEKLRAAALTGRFPPLGTGPGALELGGETRRLFDAMRLREERTLDAASAGQRDARLAAVLATLDEAIVVITDTGQVTLVNGPAKLLLGERAVAVGTSVFAALYRHEVSTTLTDARTAPGGRILRRLGHLDGRVLPCTVALLPGGEGAVLRFDTPERLRDTAPMQIDHDLDLHDRPPDGGFGPDSALTDLPVLVYDSETTGLDVRNDMTLAVGGVRMHGPRIYRADCFDMLVAPGRPIPPSSTAIHGITDAMVAASPPFAEIAPAVREAMQGCVLVGHNIGFDAAILRADAARAGLDWPEPETLCTLRLAAALWPEMTDLNLDTIATRLGVDVRGRHTALGDALVTAEIWAALLPLLADVGIHTLAQAKDFAASAKRVVKAQAEAGW